MMGVFKLNIKFPYLAVDGYILRNVLGTLKLTLIFVFVALVVILRTDFQSGYNSLQYQVIRKVVRCKH